MTNPLASEYQKWCFNTEGFFKRGFSSSEIKILRKRALKACVEGIDSEVKPFFNALISCGVLVNQELIFPAKHGMGNPESNSDRLTLSQPFTSSEKIITWEKAIERMKELRGIGKRVAISFGNFDVGTKGHKAILKDFAFTTSAWGELFILVGEDQLVSIRKGSNRPYVPHRQRMEFVAKQPGVTWVVPVVFPGTPTLEALPEFYLKLQLEMKGLAHFRLIGDKESTYESYLSQCNQADILLVYSDLPRISSATLEGAKQLSSKL